MTGKEKCRLLRQVRKEIAAANRIPYFPTDCTYQGEDCVGTCPMCEAEARYLDRALNEKVARGEPITVSGISLDTFQAGMNDVIEPEFPYEEAGVMVCDEEPPRKDPRDRTVEEIGFSANTLSCLLDANIRTVAQLLQISDENLVRQYRIPRPFVAEIREKLHQVGLTLKMEIPEPPLMGQALPLDRTPGYMIPVDPPEKDRKLRALKLSFGTRRILRRAGITTVEQLLGKTRSELRAIAGMEQKHLDEIVKKARDKGLYL